MHSFCKDSWGVSVQLRAVQVSLVKKLHAGTPQVARPAVTAGDCCATDLTGVLV